MHAVVETDEYLREAKRCRMTDEEREAFIDFIADHPTAGKEIVGTGGVRKVRFAKPGTGVAGIGSLRFIQAKRFRYSCCRCLPRRIRRP